MSMRGYSPPDCIISLHTRNSLASLFAFTVAVC
jgi:hypothetical protein